MADSLTLQLEDDGIFTSYFNLSSGSSVDIITFSNTNTVSTADHVNVTSSVLYINEAPVGEYQAQLIATLKITAENGLSETMHMDNSTITISVTESKYLKFIL